MAIKMDEEQMVTPTMNTMNNGEQPTASFATGNSVDQEADFNASLGFGLSNIFSMSNNLGSEYTNELAGNIQKMYDKLPKLERPKVSILDKDIMGKFAYSSILVSIPVETTVNYYIILLEATGRAPLTASDYMSEVQLSQRNPAHRTPVYTTDDAVDSYMHQEIMKILKIEYPKAKSFVAMDGLVVPAVQHDTTAISSKIASIAYNACRSQKAFETGAAKDINITAALAKSPTTVLKLESNMLKQTTLDELDNPVRADWIIELSAVDTANNASSINLQNAKQMLTQVSGFVDAIPEEVVMPAMYGAPAVTNIRLHPHIIIDSNATFAPTPGYSLMGLISGLVMTNENMWLASVMPKDGKGIRNTGALNLLTNIENNANHIGEVADLSPKKTSADKAYSLLRQMYSLAPIVSYDIQSFGPQTNYTSQFALAAQPGNNEHKLEAAKQIIETAYWLTNGGFPGDFNINNIFSTTGIMIPTGKWSDKTGERDIRDIDAAFIATQTGDIETINRWVLSGLPQEVTGLDPYTTRVDIIAKLVPSAVITGRTVRVTFTSEFITTLMSAAIAAGLNLSYEPEVKFAETNSLGVVGGIIGNAGISNIGGFNTRTNTGPVYQTGYSNVGYGRY